MLQKVENCGKPAPSHPESGSEKGRTLAAVGILWLSLGLAHSESGEENGVGLVGILGLVEEGRGVVAGDRLTPSIRTRKR